MTDDEVREALVAVVRRLMKNGVYLDLQPQRDGFVLTVDGDVAVSAEEADALRNLLD